MAAGGSMSGYTNTASMQGEYEAATKHFLLIGFLAMLIGSIVFGSFVIKKTDNKMQEVLMFLVATISAASYYLMWSGYGVYKKTGSDGEERVVFVAELAQRMITEPLLIYSFALVTNAESGDVVLAMGTAALMSFASEIGSAQLHPYKWAWWTLGVVLWIVLALQMYGLFVRAKEAGASLVAEIRILLLLLLLPFCAFPVLWVLGEEGLEVFPISYEVGFGCIADIVCKIVYGLYLLLSVLPREEQELEGAEKTSLV